ncbi:hypothetical protein NMY22_g18512 [Coprinellus aureogranulatus]|nr:hypothetical protein NMY22_g18512 [Coprinellus aureogranulatus]
MLLLSVSQNCSGSRNRTIPPSYSGLVTNVVLFLEAQGYVVVPGSWKKKAVEVLPDGDGIGSDGGEDDQGGSESTDGEHAEMMESDGEGHTHDIAAEEDGASGAVESEEGQTEDEAPVAPENLYSKHVMKEVVAMQKGEGTTLKTLNVIESILPCAEAPLFCFHSTIVMNAVTATGIVSYYPEWTLANKGGFDIKLWNDKSDARTGVVNRASGIVAWNTKEQRKEQSALEKYRTKRGYQIEDDCEVFHERGKEECQACQAKMRNWSQGLSMAFDRGRSFRISGRRFCWKLGEQPREAEYMFWNDRGATILVQGDGDGRAYFYDGLAKETLCLTREALYGVVS